MEWAIEKAKLSRAGREMKRAAETEDKLIVEIPLVARLRPIVVELERAVVVALDIEQVRVASVRNVHCTVLSTTPRLFSGLNRIRYRNTRVQCTKYLLF